MLRRCNKTTHEKYEFYGARGIKVCKRWFKFNNFLNDMGERPEGKTLDRIDGEKGYFKSNCRWASWDEQRRNKKNNIHITHQGQTLIAADWARKNGMDPKSLCNRLSHGWNPIEAITTPIAKNMIFLTHKGQTFTVAEWSRKLKIHKATLLTRFHSGWSTARILTTPAKKSDIFVTYQGKTFTISGWARKQGINPGTLMGRFKKGWSVKRALTTPVFVQFRNKHKKEKYALR